MFDFGLFSAWLNHAVSSSPQTPPREAIHHLGASFGEIEPSLRPF
jgi:hypothetical protein